MLHVGSGQSQLPVADGSEESSKGTQSSTLAQVGFSGSGIITKAPLHNLVRPPG